MSRYVIKDIEELLFEIYVANPDLKMRANMDANLVSRIEKARVVKKGKWFRRKKKI